MHVKIPSERLSSTQRRRHLFGWWLVLFSAATLVAKTVEIPHTGYRLTVPDSFVVSVPEGAPDILLQAARPDGNGTIQVVRDHPHGTGPQMAAVYEQKMQGALGNLSLQKKNVRTVAGRTCEFRVYQSLSGGMQIRVMAVFYADGQQGFTLHSIDVTNSPVEFEQALVSLLPPAPPSSSGGSLPIMPSLPAFKPQTADTRIPVGTSGFTFIPPAEWQPFTSDQPNGMQFGLPDKSALMEVLVVDIGEPIPDRAAFLDSSLAQIESSFGPGWTVREQTPHAEGQVNVLFKRYDGQLAGRDAQLLTIALTNGTDLVLAYGYYASDAARTAGTTMRNSILSIKADAASSPAIAHQSVTPPPSPPPAPPSTPTTTAAAMRAPGNAGQSSPSPLPAGWKSYHETTSGIHVPIPGDWVVDRGSGAITISGPEGTDAYYMTINIQALDRDTPGNANLAASVQKFKAGFSAQGANISNEEDFLLDGAPAHRFHATVNANNPGASGYSHLFYYLLFEQADVIGVLSYVSLIDDWNGYLPIVQQSEAAVRLDRSPSSAPAPASSVASSIAEPKTSREAYFALAEAVNSQQWDWVANHLTERAMLKFCKLWRNVLPEADMTEADAQADPLKTTREYLMYRQPKEDLAGYFESDRVIDGVREENPDWNLVMTTKASGGQHYLWFKRINGRWQFDD